MNQSRGEIPFLQPDDLHSGKAPKYRMVWFPTPGKSRCRAEFRDSELGEFQRDAFLLILWSGGISYVSFLDFGALDRHVAMR